MCSGWLTLGEADLRSEPHEGQANTDKCLSSPVLHLALTSEGHASAEAAHRNTAAAGRDLPKEASASLPFLSYSPGFPKPYRSESHGALAQRPKAQILAVVREL